MIPEIPEKKLPKNNNMTVVGINIGVFFVYTLICASSNVGADWIFTDLVLVGIHAAGCIITAIVVGRWVWALTGILLLVAGFSTCVISVAS